MVYVTSNRRQSPNIYPASKRQISGVPIEAQLFVISLFRRIKQCRIGYKVGRDHHRGGEEPVSASMPTARGGSGLLVEPGYRSRPYALSLKSTDG
jgi:hypothetical protein